MSSDPEVPLEPDQAPEAVHEVALEELQVKLIGLPSRISEAEELKVTEGAGVDGADGLPPPPPPPQEANTKSVSR